MLQLNRAVISCSHKLSKIGLALILVALLAMGIASLYCWLAPRTYSAHVMLNIRRTSLNGGLVRPEELPLGSLRHDRNLFIENPRNSSVFRIGASAPTPDEAVDHANKCARELEANVRSLLKADVSVIESAFRNPQPVRPKTKAILAISGFTALNLAFVGTVLFLAGLLKRRRVQGASATPQTVAA